MKYIYDHLKKRFFGNFERLSINYLIRKIKRTYQIHQNLSSVVKDLNVEVPGASTLMVLVRADLRLRLILQVRRLIPKQRNRSARLHEGTTIAVHLNQLLCLHVIGDVPGGIYTAREESRTSTVYTASRDDTPIECYAIHDHRVQWDDCIDFSVKVIVRRMRTLSSLRRKIAHQRMCIKDTAVNNG